ncbi:MAG: hypothetical protein PGN15_09785 [Aeromicrobium erythreum]
MDSEWKPLRARQSQDYEAEYTTLVAGFPLWLAPSVEQWLVDVDPPLDADRASRRLRVVIPSSGHRLLNYWRVSGTLAKVEILDYVLRELQEREERAYGFGGGLAASGPWGTQSDAVRSRVALSHILDEGGSEWRVVTDPFWSLEQRVSVEARELVTSLSGTAGDAGSALSRAWHLCYGPSPEYSRAYAEAVLAVEARVLPLTISKDATGTLGKALAHLRQTQESWDVGGLPAGAEMLVSMLGSLWRGQQRHATKDGDILGVGKSEAETAVSLAVALVHILSSGMVRRETT